MSLRLGIVILTWPFLSVFAVSMSFSWMSSGTMVWNRKPAVSRISPVDSTASSSSFFMPFFRSTSSRVGWSLIV